MDKCSSPSKKQRCRKCRTCTYSMTWGCIVLGFPNSLACIHCQVRKTTLKGLRGTGRAGAGHIRKSSGSIARIRALSRHNRSASMIRLQSMVIPPLSRARPPRGPITLLTTLAIRSNSASCAPPLLRKIGRTVPTEDLGMTMTPTVR